MIETNRVPNEFRIFSTEPELRIRFSIRIWYRLFIFLFFSPFIVLFLGHIALLILFFYNFLVFHPLQAIRTLSYDTNRYWLIPVFMFSLSLLGLASLTAVWILLGVTEIQADPKTLKIFYKLLGLSRETLISSDDIQHFNLFLQNRDTGESWVLEAVTRQRRSDKNQSVPDWFPKEWISQDLITRMNYKTVTIYSHHRPNISAWLGNLLAEFYGIELQSIFTSKPRLLHTQQSK